MANPENTYKKKMNKDLIHYSMQKEDEGKEHYSYEYERKARQLGESAGNTHPLFDLFDESKVGKMGMNEYKQVEYTCVSAITVITRNAICNGLEETKAYNLSDIILQRLSMARSIDEMKQIATDGSEMFDMQLSRLRENKAGSYYINICKNKIAEHIFEKITVEHLADEMGISADYLSKCFKKEEGVNLTSYIQAEKIKVASNMLAYSNQSIACIAEYIGITPQSYFSQVFKKHAGMTPAAYRRENKSKDFS